MPDVRAEQTLIDAAVPAYDAVIAEHRVVAAKPSATFAAARSLDFLTVRTPLLTASMWIRGLPARLAGKAVPTPPRLILAEELDMPGWLLLGERPGREIAFGAVGKFWQPAIEWRDVGRAEFDRFAEPGWGKIVANFTVSPRGDGRTLLGYECRTVTTDPASHRRFRRYWWLIRPFVAHIMRATLETIKTNAEAGRR